MLFHFCSCCDKRRIVSDYDKQQWQAEQAARDAASEKHADKMRKARERSARNAARKLERLHRKLNEVDAITEFENEFGESVLERLDKFGSAFHDLEKGRPGNALSFAQKRVVAAMNKKVKDLKNAPKIDDPDAGYERTADRWKDKASKPRSSFKSKGPKFTPRVRHIEEDFEAAVEEAKPIPMTAKKPFLRIVPDATPAEPEPEKPKRPFLRIVGSA